MLFPCMVLIAVVALDSVLRLYVQQIRTDRHCSCHPGSRAVMDMRATQKCALSFFLPRFMNQGGAELQLGPDWRQLLQLWYQDVTI